MVVFEESGGIRAKVVVVGQCSFIGKKVVVLRKSCSILAKWLYSGKVVVFGESGCIRAKVVLFGQSGCNHAKILVFFQKLFYSCKLVVFVQK